MAAETERQNGLRILIDKFPDKNPSLAGNVNLMFIPPEVLNVLVKLLNIKDEVGATKDYQGLGNHFGLDTVEVLNFEKYPNPAKQILMEGVKKGKSYLDLLVFLIVNKVDGQELLLKAWPATLVLYHNFKECQGDGQVSGLGQGRNWGQGQNLRQGHGQVRGHGQNWGQGQVRRRLEPTEDSWNCPSSVVSSVISSDECSLSQNDLNYAESVFSNIDNEQYPSARVVDNSTERTSDWVNGINPGLSRRETIGGQRRGQARHRKQRDEITEIFELDDLDNSSRRHVSGGFNIPPNHPGIPNDAPEIVSDTRDVNFPRGEHKHIDSDQAISKSLEADSRNPNIVHVEVHNENSATEVEDRLLPSNSQSGDELVSLPSNQSDDIDSCGFSPPSIIPSSYVISERNRINDEESVKGRFIPPSFISGTVNFEPQADAERVNDEESVAESFDPPSFVSGTVNFDPQDDTEISLGEEANLIPSPMSSIIERQRAIKVLVTSVGDNVTSNIVKNLVRDLGRHNIGYVAHLPGELKVNPPLNQAELNNICLSHKTWLEQTFDQSDCIIMMISDNYLDYVQPRFNIKNILRPNNETKSEKNEKKRHRQTQKQIYNMVKKRFDKNDAISKCLIPVLTAGSKPSDVPSWISSRFFLYKYLNDPDSVFTDSQLYRLLKTQFL